MDQYFQQSSGPTISTQMKKCLVLKLFEESKQIMLIMRAVLHQS